MIGHAIHVIPVLWVRRLLPSIFDFSCGSLNQRDFRIPSAFNLVSYFAWGGKDLATQSEIVVS
jgi:hypothetical protein